MSTIDIVGHTNHETVAFIGDVHLHNHRKFGGETHSGLNHRFRLTLLALHEAIEVASAKADVVCVLGDVFDTVRPTPQMIAATRDMLSGNTEIIIVAGNHDKASEEFGDNAVRVLESDNVRVVDNHPTLLLMAHFNLLLAPYRAGTATSWLLQDIKDAEETLSSRQGAPLVVGTHAGLIDDSTPPWLLHAEDAVSIDALPPDTYVVAGNWHQFRQMGNKVQIGAIVPTGFDNPSTIGQQADPYGAVMLLGKSMAFTHVTGPRFWAFDFRAHTEAELLAWFFEQIGYHNLVRIKADLDDMAQAKALGARLMEQGLISGVEIVPDAQDRQRKRDDVARATKGSESIERAIYKFVENMHHSEDVAPSAIVEKVRQYISAAQRRSNQ